MIHSHKVSNMSWSINCAHEHGLFSHFHLTVTSLYADDPVLYITAHCATANMQRSRHHRSINETAWLRSISTLMASCSKFNMFACSPAYFSLENSRTLFIHLQIMNLKSLSVRLWTLWILQANSTARSEVIPVKQQPLKNWTLETGALDSPAWQSLPFAANSAFDVRFILHSWWVNTSQANFSSLCRRLWRRLWSLLFTLGRLCSDSDRREMLRLSQ